MLTSIHGETEARISRTSIRQMGGCPVPFERQKDSQMVVPLRMRHRARGENQQTARRRLSVLWLSRAPESARRDRNASDDEDAPILCVALNVEAMYKPEDQRVSELGWAWHSRLRRVANLRSILARHGTYMATRSYAGSHRQRRQLRTTKLSLGHMEPAGAKPTTFCAARGE